MNYKNINIYDTIEFNQNNDDNDEEIYNIQFIDLPKIYESIQQSFEQKNAQELIDSLENLKLYLSKYSIESPEQFQNILFPVLVEICENTENVDLSLYGFQFISFIMNNDAYTNYMPLFSQPEFFDFCFPFLSNSNQLIIFWALDNIENFIHFHIDARDYALGKLTVESIINNFILNMDFFNEEENKFDLQVKALKILRCYTLYNIDETNADQIFEICDTILSDDPQYQILTEDALWTAYNLIQQYRKYVTQEFIDKIDKFYFSNLSEHIIPSLKILHFLISRDFTPPNSICKNFISLFFSNDKQVGKLSLDCLYLILQNQEKDATKNLIKNGFINVLGDLLSSQQFETKLKAAEVICILIEECGNELCYLLCHKGYIHGLFDIFEFEKDELKIRTLRALIEISRKMHSPFVPNQEEMEILEDLIQSDSEEISNLASFFVENCQTKQRDYAIFIKPNKRKGPNIRIKKEEIIPARNRMRLWIKPTKPKVSEEQQESLVTELSYNYYQQNNSDNEEEEIYDPEMFKNYEY